MSAAAGRSSAGVRVGTRRRRPARKSVIAASSYVAAYRKAVASCASVTYSLPKVGSSTLHARQISFAAIGDNSFAARFSVTSGALDGFDVIQVEVGSRDVVVGLSFFSMDPGDVEAATIDAVDTAAHVLGTGDSNG